MIGRVPRPSDPETNVVTAMISGLALVVGLAFYWVAR